jgi:hypothetical protein
MGTVRSSSWNKWQKSEEIGNNCAGESKPEDDRCGTRDECGQIVILVNRFCVSLCATSQFGAQDKDLILFLGATTKGKQPQGPTEN